MSKTSSTSSGETKQNDAQLHLLGAKLIPSATTKEELVSTDLVRNLDAAILCSFGKFTLEERQLAVNFIERVRDLKETVYQGDGKDKYVEPYKDFEEYDDMLDVMFQNFEEYLASKEDY
jgi:hypothetical protein